MAKRHKKHRHEEHIDETWLIPYADVLTLLLALFIVLFASSTIDAKKFEQLSQVFNQIFQGGMGVMENPSPVETKPTTTTGEEKQDGAYLEDQKSLGEIKSRVDNYIAVNELEDQLATELTDEGLLITLRDSILFDPGSAIVKQEYRSITTDIAKLLQFDVPRSVVVAGHTDNVPMNTPQFPSNWDLSVSRATNFLKLLVQNPDLDPLMFSVKGYGEYKPIALNNTSEGRAQNRRVEVLIQPLVLKDGTPANTTN